MEVYFTIFIDDYFELNEQLCNSVMETADTTEPNGRNQSKA